MKKTILLAAIAFLAGSAQAQWRGGSINASSSMNGSRSSVYNNGGTDPTSQASVSATNPGEFVPSTFESYKEAVTIGQEELDSRPLSVGELARILQARKKSEIQKPALIAEQDNDGNVIISSGKQRELGKNN